MLKMLDLFSGIGGFSLAARWTEAIETVAFCEIDPFCQKVLAKHWPGVPIISDIREVTGERIRRVIADTEGREDDQRNGRGVDEEKASGECGDTSFGIGDKYDAPDTNQQGPQGRHQHRECTGKLSVGENHTEHWQEDWYSVALRTCVRRVDDGLPGRVDKSGGVSTEPVLERTKDKTSTGRAHRLKALGNSIVPQITYQILMAIVETEQNLRLGTTAGAESRGGVKC